MDGSLNNLIYFMLLKCLCILLKNTFFVPIFVTVISAKSKEKLRDCTAFSVRWDINSLKAERERETDRQTDRERDRSRGCSEGHYMNHSCTEEKITALKFSRKCLLFFWQCYAGGNVD